MPSLTARATRFLANTPSDGEPSSISSTLASTWSAVMAWRFQVPPPDRKFSSIGCSRSRARANFASGDRRSMNSSHRCRSNEA